MYLPQHEHDACGIGFIANIKRKRSNETIQDALNMLQNMAHRGGCGAEPETGDGAGITFEIPFEYFDQIANSVGIELPKGKSYGVGVIFFPKEAGANKICRAMLHQYAHQLELKIIW